MNPYYFWCLIIDIVRNEYDQHLILIFNLRMICQFNSFIFMHLAMKIVEMTIYFHFKIQYPPISSIVYILIKGDITFSKN